MSRSILLIALLIGFSSRAMSAEVIMQAIPSAQVVGEGRLTYAFWDVYDATLYAPSGKLDQNRPFALSLRYMREINGNDIAMRSADEIRGQGFSDEATLARWQSQMQSIFPNVESGTILSAIFFPGDKTIFFNGRNKIGTIPDANFTREFSNIWLGDKTSKPHLRKRLLGLS